MVLPSMRCSTIGRLDADFPSIVFNRYVPSFSFSILALIPPPTLNGDRFVAFVLAASVPVPYKRHEALAANWFHHAIEQMVQILLPPPFFRGYPFRQPNPGARSNAISLVNRTYRKGLD